MRVLITNTVFRGYSGSELVSLELAEFFLDRGDEVVFYTNWSKPRRAELVALEATGRFRLIDNPATVFKPNFDLMWLHHNMIPPAVVEALVKGIRTRIIWHHMSPFVDIELPILGPIEDRLADRITAISPEVRDVLKEFGIRSKVHLLPNPTPDRFIDFPASPTADRLTSVLVVSNHPPTEVLEAMALLAADGITAEQIGDGAVPMRITPEILNAYDAVLTIGKTVQYCLPLGRPIYEYDHFGGPGWLDQDNFEAESVQNFSGRASPIKKSAQQIRAELISGYADAASFASTNATRFGQRYRLSTAIEALLAQLPKRARRKSLPAAQAKRLAAFVRLYREGLIAAVLRHDHINQKL